MKNNTRILICGSLKTPLPEDEGRELIKQLKSIIMIMEALLINGNGKNLGPYVNIATTEIAKELWQEPLRSDIYYCPESELCINYLPVQKAFCVGDLKYEDVLQTHWEQMILREKPMFSLFIGGADGTRSEFELCKKHNVPCMGIPWYGGSGKEIFEEITQSEDLLNQFFIVFSEDETARPIFDEIIEEMKAPNASIALLADICDRLTSLAQDTFYKKYPQQ